MSHIIGRRKNMAKEEHKPKESEESQSEKPLIEETSENEQIITING